MTPLKLQVADWGSVLFQLPMLRVLYLHNIPVAGVRIDVTLERLEELHLSALQGANQLVFECPVLRKASFSTGGAGWWSEREMIHPGSLHSMVNSQSLLFI